MAVPPFCSAMDERTALAVTAVRAVETADRARTLWTDDDRSWASRAAAEVVGADAPRVAFVARRAQLALERLEQRRQDFARFAAAWRWRPWVGTAIVALAFAFGAAADAVGGAQRINILYSPVLPLLAWNLVVYALLAGGFVLRYGEASAPGPLRGLVARLAGVVRRVRGGPRADDDPTPRAHRLFVAQWSALATPVYAARAARILHVAAAALALGVIAGLYVRGLAFEYRATWESTFLDASAVRGIVAAAYWAGAEVTRIPVPDVAQVAAIRAPASENAALWLHLMAATLAVVVIVPRLLLALGALVLERHREAHLLDDLRDPYFARLLRGFHPGTATVRVVPYSYEATPALLAALEGLLGRALGGNVALAVAAPVAYGDEDRVPADAAAADGAPLVVLFNATATPEPEAHGRMLATLKPRARPLMAVVDEAAFNTRWPDDVARRDARRALWRALATEHALDAGVRRSRSARCRGRRGGARSGTRRRARMTAATIALSLISHTNAGKTTLARTLLARDVGEVRDAPHVTTEATSFPLLTTAEGDALVLWDTPGFGDSARLARRLAQQANPVVWFLAQLWDRWRDRPFWLTQQAVRNVRDSADVILYLVNAAEAPGDAGYLKPELDVLGWLGKPVLVLLNQTGRPRPAADEAAEVARWREALAPHPHVRDVLALDAFARCWVQEFTLFAAIAPLLAPERRAGFARLSAAWAASRWAQFDDAIAALAVPVANAICARVVVPSPPMLRRLGNALGVGGGDADESAGRALRELARPLQADIAAAMTRVIARYRIVRAGRRRCGGARRDRPCARRSRRRGQGRGRRRHRVGRDDGPRGGPGGGRTHAWRRHADGRGAGRAGRCGRRPCAQRRARPDG